ncbi:MAG: hypothetical protein U5R46_08405 [Gammaproteobacteria bacterium]|nr:hypothetical protein [Gammaproteobacteria bacterium]
MTIGIDVTGDDVAQLNDSDLRRLIGELCEADCERAGLSPLNVRWGGHQNAKDGGLDVVVETEAGLPLNSSIPRRNTGFQVKTSDMPRHKILKEMCPKGVLREEIKDLMKKGGAYVIVSSKGSTAHPALKDRLAAMKEAIGEEEKKNDLVLSFLDRGQVASWVRAHPVYVMWVRDKVGKPLAGWQAYGNWANAPGGAKEEYLLDDGLRLQDGMRPTQDGVTIQDGIENLRAVLSSKSNSVRLTGLSGVGKTRLVQALFDNRVGDNALNRHQVFYTDTADDPDPKPGEMVRQLIAARTRAIVIVDNCPPELHRRLTEIASEAHSTVSILTVEYDVREDIPEETNVYRLEPASTEVIEKLISKRFEHISQVDCRTVAEFSGGNARIAIALAATIRQGEAVSGLQEETLFKRLFEQRQGPDDDLLRSAEACSLVYSFDGVDVSSDESELSILANLAGRNSTDLYRHVAILKERDLVQSRSRWRAVLPHAIANRLAKRALDTIPGDKLALTFLNSGTERLVRSFTRRLGYLHDSQPAQEIVENWLTRDGWLGKEIDNLNSLGVDAFKNIAPVSPDKTLEAIERAASGHKGGEFCSRANRHAVEFVKVLRHLAYDPDLFERSVRVLRRFALSEKKTETYHSTREVLKSLFHVCLSGTRAPLEMRVKAVEDLLNSTNTAEKDMGLMLLEASLETSHFRPPDDFDFGARSRDFGFQPDSQEEVSTWYGRFIRICTHIAVSQSGLSEQLRALLANSLRGLWLTARVMEEIETAAEQIHNEQPWNEGWVAIKGTIRFVDEHVEGGAADRLRRLERFLRPADTLQKARAYALAPQELAFELEDPEEDDGLKRIENETLDIAKAVAQDEHVFKTLLSEIVTKYHHRLFTFGMGLADGSKNKEKSWRNLYDAFKKAPAEKRHVQVLCGFLSFCGETERGLYDKILDQILYDELLGESFPVFEASSNIDARGVERLYTALDIGKVDVKSFLHLRVGRAHETISDDDLAGLLRKLQENEGGNDVAVEILRMRFHRSKDEKKAYSEGLMATTREILTCYEFSRNRQRHGTRDNELARLTKACMEGAEGVATATIVCQRFIEAMKENRVYDFDYPEFLGALAGTQPFVFLDMFTTDELLEDHRKLYTFPTGLRGAENPLNQVSDEDLIKWCEADPGNRYSTLTLALKPFEKMHEIGPYVWKSVVYDIIDNTPELKEVLENLALSLRPSAWSGSRADDFQAKTALFKKLFDYKNPEVRAWARTQYTLLQQDIEEERKREERYERNMSASFE